MRRRIVSITLLLILCAIVNVMIAWTFAIWSFPGSESTEDAINAIAYDPAADETEYLTTRRWRRTGTTVYVVERHREPGSPQVADNPASIPLPTWWTYAESDFAWFERVELFGYPGRSMACFLHAHNSASMSIDLNDIAIFQHRIVGPLLPLRPILPGFLINTFFYAALLWLLFLAPFTARRMIRRRRGLCEKCAYPISVSPVCTECGAKVRRKSKD